MADTLGPGIRETIEKTVGYVVKNGSSFEERLKVNGGDKFSFLHEADAGYAYYQKLLQEARGPQETSANGDSRGIRPNKTAVQQEQEQEQVPEPPAFQYLTKLPPISSLDLDIIKLAAQFVAKNGSQYGQGLLEHQRVRNQGAQFEFLNPLHSLHQLYSEYVKQYRALFELDPAAVQARGEDVVQRSYQRAKYERLHRAKAKDEKRIWREKQVAYASVDWQDFAMVGRVQFDAVDEVRELALPMRRDELVFRSLESKRSDQKDTEPELEPSQLPTEQIIEVKAPPVEEKPTPVQRLAPKGMKIRAAGESRLKNRAPGANAATSASEPTIKCPITGQLIPELKFDAHLKVLLIDPRYKEQQDNFVKKNFMYSSNLSTDEVYENIKRMTNKRKGDTESQRPAKKHIGPSI